MSVTAIRAGSTMDFVLPLKEVRLTRADYRLWFTHRLFDTGQSLPPKSIEGPGRFGVSHLGRSH